MFILLNAWNEKFKMCSQSPVYPAIPPAYQPAALKKISDTSNKMMVEHASDARTRRRFHVHEAFFRHSEHQAKSVSCSSSNHITYTPQWRVPETFVVGCW
jgi:hypothetical protein